MIREEEFIVSATQVSTYELCPRKWAFRYINGIKAPPNKFAVLGLDTHGHLESWLRNSIVPQGEDKSVKLAQALIPLLPPPQAVDPKNVELEQYFNIAGATFNMKVDLFMPKWGDFPYVFDHKTGGNPDYWLKTPDDLVQDIQASLYGGWALMKSLAPEVALQWNYVRTKGAIITRPVATRIQAKHIRERLGKTVDSAHEMEAIAKSGARALDIVYDAKGCDAYGGCPYKEQCNLQPLDRVRSIMSQQQGPGLSPNTQQFLSQLSNGQVNPPAQPQQGFQAQPQQAPPPPQQGFQQAPPQQAPLFAAQPQAASPQPMGSFSQQPVPAAPPQPAATQAPPPPQPTGGFAPQPQQQGLQAPPPPPAQQPPLTQAPEQGKTNGKPGRPKKASGNDPWVAFAAAALGPALSSGVGFEQAIQSACGIADQMMEEAKKRK